MEESRKKTENFVVLPPVRCRPQYYSGTTYHFSTFAIFSGFLTEISTNFPFKTMLVNGQ
jgi:hypothetical protein